MAASGPHPNGPGWRRAVEAGAQLYRLAARMTAPEAERLAARLAEVALSLPVELTLREKESRARIEAEALLAIAARLGYVAREEADAASALLDALREPAPAPNPPSPAPPAPAAAPPRPSGAPARRAPASGGTDRLLIDGCNFLGCAPGYMLGDEESRDRLRFRLQEYARKHPAHRLLLFFDGGPVARRQLGGIVERATGGREADASILDALRAVPEAERGRCTVVTDDRELSARARELGAQVRGVAWLAERLERKPRPEAEGPSARQSGLSRNELSEWEEFFRQPPQRPGK